MCIKRCLGHCSKLNWEIVVVDDASPDGTQAVVKQLQKEYGEDRIVSQEGVASSADPKHI